MKARWWRTKAEGNAKDFTTHTAEHESTSIINAVDLRVTKLEGTDNISRPGGDDSNSDKGNQARDKTERVKDGGNRQDTKSDLGLHHEGDGTDPTDLQSALARLLEEF